MSNIINRFATTVSYVTCIPVPGWHRSQKAQEHELDLSGLAKYLSAAGLLIGVLLCLSLWLLDLLDTDSILTASLLTIAWLSLTGGLHFDGLMDTADGIFSHQPIARMLEIMSDSRVGNYGVMVGIGTLMIKVAALASLPSAVLYPALLLCPSWARWCESFAMGKFAYLRKEGMGKVWHDTTKFPSDIFTGLIVPLLATCVIILFAPRAILALTVGTIGTGLMMSYALAKKLGGHTGDTYGSVVELAELGGLLLTALLIK